MSLFPIFLVCVGLTLFGPPHLGNSIKGGELFLVCVAICGAALTEKVDSYRRYERMLNVSLILVILPFFLCSGCFVISALPAVDPDNFPRRPVEGNVISLSLVLFAVSIICSTARLIVVETANSMPETPTAPIAGRSP